MSTQASLTHIVTTSHRPLIAVFFAGATGIGHYTLRELSRVTASTPGAHGFRAYIVARKPKVAAEVIAECSEIITQGEGVSGVFLKNSGSSGGDAEEHGLERGDGGAAQAATAEFIFIQTPGLELMKNVDAVCEEIIEEEARRVKNNDGYYKGGDDDGKTKARIDFLLFTQGCAVYQPRKDTPEGLDFTMAILYYSRMRAITRLLPLLLNSSSSSPSTHHQHATILSIFAPGMEDPSTNTFPTKLSLRDNYTYNAARSNIVYMHTLFFESLAEKYPGMLSLTHMFPGLVNGPGFENPDMPRWFRLMWRYFVVPVLGRWVFTTSEDCGRRALGCADGSKFPVAANRPGEQGKDGVEVMKGTNGEIGGGSYAVGSRGEDCFKRENYEGLDRVEVRRVVWEHTMAALETIEKGEVFRG